MAEQAQTAPAGYTLSRRARAAFRLFTATHGFMYRLTGGRIFGRIPPGPVLVLTTTGRKTGKQRTTPLIYLADGDRLVVVGSAGGAARHPDWVLNLQANAEGEVQVGRRTVRVRAEIVGGEERHRLWPLLTAMYRSFDEMQRNTTRELPVIALRPVESDVAQP